MGFLDFVGPLEWRAPIFYSPARARGGSSANPIYKKTGERIAAWVRKIGVKDRRIKPNHAWRHLFKTRAREAGLEPALRDVLQDHAPANVGEKYGDWPIKVLADAVNKMARFDV